jgi:hypothetical protein
MTLENREASDLLTEMPRRTRYGQSQRASNLAQS